MGVLRSAAALLVPLALLLPAGARAEGASGQKGAKAPPAPSDDRFKYFKGVARPEATVDITTAADRALQAPQTRRCFVFQSWLVIQVDAPGFDMGPAQVRARPRPAGVPIEEACRASDAHDVIFGDDGSDVLGMAGGIVFLVEVDSFGGSAGLALSDPATGKVLLDVQQDVDGPTIATPITGDSVDLRFYQTLDHHCARVSVGSCWKSIRRDNKIPDTVRLPPPVCPKSKAGRFQVFAPVHIADVRHPVVVFEDGRPLCEESP